MTPRHEIRCKKNDERRSARQTWLVLVTVLSWLGCYTPLPSDEYVCRRCEERCPGGLVCHDGRCLPSCEGGCAAGSECVEDVCLPSSGEPQCEETLSFNLCVGRPIDPGQIAPIGDPASLLVVESSLPHGLELDPESGELRGEPESESTGRISVRSGELGAFETTYEVTATELCVEITTTRIAWCAGKDQTAELEATDDADYQWQTPELPGGVERDGATLHGNIAQPGTYTIHVTLVEGEIERARGEIRIVVEACEEPTGAPDAGTEAGAPGPLQISTTSLGPICAGPSYTSKPLEASGGDGAYRWSLEGDTLGFSIDPETGVLTRTSPASGHVELTVRVEDGEGSSDTQSVGLDIVSSEDARCGGNPAVPVTITASTLVSACAGAAYLSAPLAATGGDGSYTWSLIEPPGWLSLNPATNSLVGTAPTTADTLRIDVRVVDGKGATDEASLALEVRAANDPLCAPTPLEITTTELAEACIGDSYFQTLTAIGGAGDYAWRHNGGLPPGLTIQEGGIVRGTISDDAEPGAYQVDFRVTSGSVINTAVNKTLPLRVRSCRALVFIAEDSATSRLLVTRSPYASARELSDGMLGPGEGVISFRKSSSSSKLAFLVGNFAASTPARLYMADASTLEVRALDWPAELGASPSVLDYVWSTDGTYVGVVARTAQQTVLAVVSGETDEITSRVDVGSYQRQLFAVEEQLCYLVAGFDSQSDLLCNDVDAEAKVSPISRPDGGFFTALIEGGQFIAGEQSYLAVLGSVNGPLGQVEYHDLQSGRLFPSIDHVFSPTLRWAAGLNFDGDQFELIVSEPDLESEDPTVLAPLPDCEAMLAWSKDEHTLVCQGSDNVRVFELGTDGSVLRTYGITASDGHVIGEARRVISDDGRWFAYDEGLALYLVDLDAPVPTSVLVHEQTQLSLYSGLELDAAGSRLFYHQASELRAIALGTVALGEGEPLPLNGSVLLSAPPSCRLDYVVAPDVWCGADAIPATFFPSPEGDEVAFLSTSRQLHVANLETLKDGPRQVTQLPVKCTRPDGEIRCNEHVAWIRGR